MANFYINATGLIYTGDMQPGDREATQTEIDRFNLASSAPNADCEFDATINKWVQKRFTKKDFLNLCGIPQVARFNAAINSGNVMAKTAHDFLFVADYIDVTDPATIELVSLLASTEGGDVLTSKQAAVILKGKIYES